MRKAQGLPIEMIILIALALLVLVVVGAFFISGFGQATGGVQIIEATQAQCNSLCQTMTSSAFNYDNCDTGTNSFNDTINAVKYACICSSDFGACTVTLRSGDSCVIQTSLYSNTLGDLDDVCDYCATETEATACGI